VGHAVLQISKHDAAEGVFQPEDLRVLVTAFDDLEKSGARFDSDSQRQQVRDTLAKCIIEEATSGERDKGRLRDRGLLLYCQSTLRKGPRTPLEDHEKYRVVVKQQMPSTLTPVLSNMPSGFSRANPLK
jgi:hypothetical protein